MSDDTPLVPQPHGGALLSGGKPGNKGGGRKPDWFRTAARDLIEQYNLLPRLAAIGAGMIGEIHQAKDAAGNLVAVYCATPAKDQIKAIEVLSKLGIGFQTAVTDGDGGPIAVFVAAATDAAGRPLKAGEVAPLQPRTATAEDSE